MSWSLAGGLVQLRREVDAAFPGRSTLSDGTLGDTAHAARKSDHNPDERDVVRAWDCTRDVVDGIDVAERLAEWLRAGRDPRVKYVIFRRRIFSSDIAPWVWRPYSGANPHEHHVHVSVQPYPVGDSDRPWGFTREDDDMPTPDEIAKAVWGSRILRRETDAPEDTIEARDALGYAARFGFLGLENDKAERARDAALAARLDSLERSVASLVSLLQGAPVPPPAVPAAAPARRPS